MRLIAHFLAALERAARRALTFTGGKIVYEADNS